MGGPDPASQCRPGRDTFEWPTWLALAGCYLVWGAALWWHDTLGWAWCVPGALTIAFHSSLQHEALHGHPTRSQALNEALVFPALGLFLPFRRFRALHLRHHNDERLTDPHDDPESWYLAQPRWQAQRRPVRLLFAANATLAGRLTIGPALAIVAFVVQEWPGLRDGVPGRRSAWVRHGLGLIPVATMISVVEMPVWFYVLFGAYPGYALIMLRSFIEHRAATEIGHRTAIVEGGLLMRLLFLNNNFHAVHHRMPRLAWYRVPAEWRARRAEILAQNGGNLVRGYGEVVRRWFWRPREPLVHPFREDGAQ